MCTIGIARLGDDDYLLFKNKDFPRRSFDDRIVSDAGVFGVQGVATWEDADPAADRFSGLSVGANSAGLLCADANVAGARDQTNYDELVEIALQTGGGVKDGIAAIEAAVTGRPSMWANIVMIDDAMTAALEIQDQRVVVTPLDDATARTNHHLTLDPPKGGLGSPTTEDRLEAASRRLGLVETLDDVLRLQRAHDDGETGICSHVASQTVYSYVLRRHDGETTLHVAKGQPCVATERAEIDIPLGGGWSPGAEAKLRSAYPSTQV